jgi:hypothetical protein
MPEYVSKFKKVLKEYDNVDITRNPDDANINGNVPPEEFNVEPMDADVGFRSNNMERDVDVLKGVLEDIEKINGKMKQISETVAGLERSFNGIGKTSKTIANINQKLHDLNGELEGYIISLPAQKDDQEAEMAPEEEGAY